MSECNNRCYLRSRPFLFLFRMNVLPLHRFFVCPRYLLPIGLQLQFSEAVGICRFTDKTYFKILPTECNLAIFNVIFRGINDASAVPSKHVLL